MGASFVLRALLCVVLSGALVATTENEKMIACYFTNWSQYRHGIGSFKPENVDPHLCTHLFFAFAKINETRNTIEPIEWNYASALHPGILKLKEANPKLKLVLSVGGYNAPLSAWLSASRSDKVNTFANNVVRYLRRDRFDGLDIDWETPDQKTKTDFIRLIKALRTAIDREQVQSGEERLLLIADVAANKHKVQYYSPPQLARLADNVVVMAYDFYGKWSESLGHHSPLFLQRSEPDDSFFSQHQAIEMWRRAGVPLNKMVLGLAAYGRAMLLSSPALHRPGDRFTGEYPEGAPFTKEEGFYAYYEACKFPGFQGWTEVYMEQARVPYVYGALNNRPVWIGYDNPQSITEKTVYAVSRGMAGVMLWALDFDDFTGTVCGQGTPYPLLRAINQVIDKTPRCSQDKDCELEGMKGKCIVGFCGCAASFISTKNFCSGDQPPPAVVPARRLRRPHTSSHRHSHARGPAVSSQRVQPFRQSAAAGSRKNPGPRRSSGNSRRRPVPGRSPAVSRVESAFKFYSQMSKDTDSSGPARGSSSLRHISKSSKETSSSRHTPASPKDTSSSEQSSVQSTGTSPNLSAKETSVPRQSSQPSKHTFSSKRSSGPSRRTSSRRKPIFAFSWPADSGVVNPFTHKAGSWKGSSPQRHSEPSRGTSPSEHSESSKMAAPSKQSRSLKMAAPSKHPASPKVTSSKNPASPKVTSSKNPASPKVTSAKNPASPKVTPSKNPASPKVTPSKNPASPKVTPSTKRPSRSSRVGSPYVHSWSSPRAVSSPKRSPGPAEGDSPVKKPEGKGSSRVVSPRRWRKPWSAPRFVSSPFSKPKPIAYSGVRSPFRKPSHL